jgi:ABC-type nitrate/sulfonate/bicarbonate transport system permease component
VRRVNVAGWLFVVLVTLLVEAGVRAFDYEQSIATPSSTFRALYDQLAEGTLSGEIGFTLEAYLEGLALAIVIGVAVGVIIGSSRTLLDGSSLIVEFMRPIPAVALIPLAIVFFGPFGIAAHRFVVAYAAAWPILINTIYGVRGVDRMLHDVARTSGVDGLNRLFRVTLPAALPSIATGIRISAAIALVVCVTAEFRTGAGGVGDYMEDQQLADNIPELYAAVLLVAILGYGVNIALRAVQRRTLFWAGEDRSTQ